MIDTHSGAARLRVTIGLVTVALLLSGCGPAPIETDPTPTAAPVLTPTPEPLSAPRPILGIACADLLSVDDLDTVVSAPIQAAPPSPDLDSGPVVRSVGGLDCTWSNGQEPFALGDRNDSYVGIRVMVLPEAAAQWERYEEFMTAMSLSTSSCHGPPLWCEAAALIGDSWVTVDIGGARSEEAALALASSIFTSVGTAGPGAPPWAAPSSRVEVPLTCAEVIADAEVEEVLGLATPVYSRSYGDGGGWSLYQAAWALEGGPHCGWPWVDDEAGPGGMSILAGGVWAWEEILASHPELARNEVDLEPLSAGDRAWQSCEPGPAGDVTCTVDLVVAGHWIQLWVTETTRGPVDVVAASGALGSAIAERLNAP